MPLDEIHRYRFEDLQHTPEGERQWQLVERFNQLTSANWDDAEGILAELFPGSADIQIMPPLWAGRTHNIRIGRRCFINGGVVLDGSAPLTIGHHTLIGPGVRLMTTYHPVDPWERQHWAFWAKGITIGENVWIGANALICAGVIIGDHSVIGAGSVVTRDVPPCTLVAGNPAQVIRELDPPDLDTLYELNP